MEKDENPMDKDRTQQGERGAYQLTGGKRPGENVAEHVNASPRNAEDWATDHKRSSEPSFELFQKYGPAIQPDIGRAYDGPIVHRDSQSFYQASRVNGYDVLIEHKRTSLNSVQANVFTSDRSVSIRYVSESVGIAKPAMELDGQRSPEHLPKGAAGIGRV
ncbi:KfrB domain-containing protein [Pseudomonas sp. P4795]|uniref:KfrB domain-containing protein n=1 Tax=Pseudomonas sp. P4795 TaxID=3409915 RepID=UPI003B5A36B7